MKRKFTNDQLFQIYSWYNNNGKSIVKSAKKFKISYSDAYYRIHEYDRRIRLADSQKVNAVDNNNNIIRVNLNPIVTTYPSMENAWQEIYDRFKPDDRAVIFKFYNTVLSNAGILTTKEPSYEQ